MAASAVLSTFTGDLFIDGVLYGTRWAGDLTYSFADTAADFGPGYRFTFSGLGELNAAQHAAMFQVTLEPFIHTRRRRAQRRLARGAGALGAGR